MSQVLPVLVGLFLASSIGGAQHSIKAEDIPRAPNRPFNFPQRADVLLDFLNRGDIASMRLHAWRVFAGLTGPSAIGVPRFRTWYSRQETFSPDDKPHVLFDVVELARQLLPPPAQLNVILETEDLAERALLLERARDTIPFSSVYFNPPAHKQIREKREIHGVKVRLCSTSDLSALVTSYLDATPRPPLSQWKVEDFPGDSVAVKAAWWVVSQTGLSVLPIWDPPPNNIILPDGMPPGKWRRVVFVDPHRSPAQIPKGETACESTTDTSKRRCGKVVSIQSIYSFSLDDQAMVDAIKNDVDVLVGGYTPALHDYLILTGLHFTTKEIPAWVWATAWWHASPNSGPFAKGRPAQVKGLWRNYLMNVSYDMTLPESNRLAVAHACFNPYLEARQASGTFTNCMTCHRLAAIPTPAGSPGNRGDTSVGKIADDDDRLRDQVKLDFLWSLARSTNECNPLKGSR